MYLQDVGVVVWLVVGTIGINAMLGRVRAGRMPPVAFIIVSVALSIVPLALAQCRVFTYSAWYLVVACITFFWFCILASRMRRAT